MTIKTIFIMNLSGYLFFQKDFSTSIDHKLSSLIVTMIQFAKKSTGRKISFIELETTSITILVEEEVQLVCAIFHDRSDGYDFGQLVTQNIVQKFIQEYGKKFSISEVSKYKGFSSKIPEVFRSLSTPILNKRMFSFLIFKFQNKEV